MNLASFGPSWFAIQVKPRYERIVAMCLREKGYEEFLPLAKTAVAPKMGVEKPLYTGYVFCHFDPYISAPIVTTPGVVRLVGNGSIPIAIPDMEIEAVRALVNSEYLLYALAVHKRGRLGARYGRTIWRAVGILLRLKSTHRLIVSINVLGRSSAVELHASWVESAKTYTRSQGCGSCIDHHQERPAMGNLANSVAGTRGADSVTKKAVAGISRMEETTMDDLVERLSQGRHPVN